MRPVLLWLACVALAGAEHTNWTKPSGQYPSFTDTYTVGEKIILSWLPLNASTNDLWLTRYNTSTDNFSLRIAVTQDISVASNFEWLIAINNTEVLDDTRFLLQFLPTGDSYDPSATPSIPSPAFNLILVNQLSAPNGTVSTSTSTSTSPSSTSTSTGASADGSSSSNPASTSSVANTSGQSQLSTTAKIGIVIGCLVALAVILTGLIFGFFAWNRHRRRVRSLKAAEEKAVGPYEMLADKRQASELNSKDTAVYELNHSKETFISEAGGSMLHELDSVVKKPGLHELPG